MNGVKGFKRFWNAGSLSLGVKFLEFAGSRIGRVIGIGAEVYRWERLVIEVVFHHVMGMEVVAHDESLIVTLERSLSWGVIRMVVVLRHLCY